MGKRLGIEFFNRSSVSVAKDLLGKYLVREIKGKKESYMIVETEAYEGKEDKAFHAHRGETPRNFPMFGEPSTIYVYFTYGIHWMLNIVCGMKGHPSAVLIRGVDAITGPARLTKNLHIDKSLNGHKLGKKSGLWVEEGKTESKLKILKTKRVGIDYAGPVWTNKLLRFVLKQEKNEKQENSKK